MKTCIYKSANWASLRPCLRVKLVCRGLRNAHYLLGYFWEIVGQKFACQLGNDQTTTKNGAKRKDK